MPGPEPGPPQEDCPYCGFGPGPWGPKDKHQDFCEWLPEFLRTWRPDGVGERGEHGTVSRYMYGCNCLRCYRAWIDHQIELE